MFLRDWSKKGVQCIKANWTVDNKVAYIDDDILYLWEYLIKNVKILHFSFSQGTMQA